MDLRDPPRLLVGGGSMGDLDDLIERLCTLAGMLMEDASALAVAGDPAIAQAERLAVVRSAAVDAAAIIDTASILSRRSISEWERDLEN